ncbi:MAG: DNA repair protein RadA [Deltaproteobacteria bacterium]|nr:DNA repair protein RadA [Deltaproteobacteria bacterium]
MAKVRTRYICQECGHDEAKWLGKCPSCNAWSSLFEEVERKAPSVKAKGRPAPGARQLQKAEPITKVNIENLPRILLDMGDLDRVLGGGLVQGALTLIGGEPGVGKSTLLLSVAMSLAKSGQRVLYVSAEESVSQTRLRAERLNALHDDLFILSETDMGAILEEVGRISPDAVVLDSVQTVYAPELESAPGSVGQVREVTSRMMHLAKGQNISCFLVGHVTKDGGLAGPRTLEHMVDTVLAFESTRGGPFRILRADKNRFGSVSEIAVFEMRGEGLTPVHNPSALFLAERPKDAPGSVVTACVEGTRPLLVEVQGLCSQTAFGNPRRTTQGVDNTRTALIAAVLEKRCGLSLAGNDLFINVAGGVTVLETAVDLPIALAMASSLQNRPVPPGMLCFGEIGLSGEVRGVQHTEGRLAEAAKLGFTSVVLPAAGIERIQTPKGLALMPVKTLDEALDAALGRYEA